MRFALLTPCHPQPSHIHTQVQRKSLAQVASELSLLQQLAAAGRLPAEALAGGTISVSNIGEGCVFKRHTENVGEVCDFMCMGLFP